MTAPKLTEAQRRLLSDWIRNKPQGGYMFGPAVAVAKSLDARGLMIVEDNGYMRGNPERWYVTFTGKGVVQAAKVRDELRAEAEAFKQGIDAGRAALRGEA